MVNWELSSRHFNFQVLGEEVLATGVMLLWQAMSEGGKQQFRDFMSLRLRLCRVGVNGGLLHEFAELCLESLCTSSLREDFQSIVIWYRAIDLCVICGPPLLAASSFCGLVWFAWEAVLKP